MYGDESMINTTRPLNQAERDLEDTTNRFFEYVSVFLFFFVYIPIFLWINCVNVSDWHRMYPNQIITKLISTTIITGDLEDPWNVYFTFSCTQYSSTTGTYSTQTCYARLYFDLLYWYLFIFTVAIISYIICKSPTLRIAFRKRIYLGIDLPYIKYVEFKINYITQIFPIFCHV